MLMENTKGGVEEMFNVLAYNVPYTYCTYKIWLFFFDWIWEMNVKMNCTHILNVWKRFWIGILLLYECGATNHKLVRMQIRLLFVLLVTLDFHNYTKLIHLIVTHCELVYEINSLLQFRWHQKFLDWLLQLIENKIEKLRKIAK